MSTYILLSFLQIDIWKEQFCEWNGTINDLGELMFFQCPPDAFMAGVRSVYDSNARDRE